MRASCVVASGPEQASRPTVTETVPKPVRSQLTGLATLPNVRLCKNQAHAVHRQTLRTVRRAAGLGQAASGTDLCGFTASHCGPVGREVSVNLKTAARRLGVHYQTAYRWVRSGQLVAVKVGAGYEISDAALARFEAQRDATERVARERRCRPGTGTRRFVRRLARHPRPDARRRDPRSESGDPAGRAAWRPTCSATARSSRCDPTTTSSRSPKSRTAIRSSSVKVASIARDVPFTRRFAQRVAEAGGPVFMPQVPQRDVRRCVPTRVARAPRCSGGCFSLICVPIARGDYVEGALPDRSQLARSTLHAPTTCRVVEALAHRVAASRSDRGAAAPGRVGRAGRSRSRRRRSTGRTAIDTIAPAAQRAIAERRRRRHAGRLAILDLELRHVGVTKQYAALLGHDSAQAMRCRARRSDRRPRPPPSARWPTSSTRRARLPHRCPSIPADRRTRRAARGDGAARATRRRGASWLRRTISRSDRTGPARRARRRFGYVPRCAGPERLGPRERTRRRARPRSRSPGSARPRTRRRRAAPRVRSAPKRPSAPSPTPASSPATSTASRGRARSPTSTSPRSTSTSARRTRCGRRRGAAGWRGPRPRRTSRRRRFATARPATS